MKMKYKFKHAKKLPTSNANTTNRTTLDPITRPSQIGQPKAKFYIELSESIVTAAKKSRPPSITTFTTHPEQIHVNAKEK